MTKTAFRNWWQSLDGDWIPKSFAHTVAGCSTAAIANAVRRKTLDERKRTINGRALRVVRLEQVLAMQGRQNLPPARSSG